MQVEDEQESDGVIIEEDEHDKEEQGNEWEEEEKKEDKRERGDGQVSNSVIDLRGKYWVDVCGIKLCVGQFNFFFHLLV